MNNAYSPGTNFGVDTAAEGATVITMDATVDTSAVVTTTTVTGTTITNTIARY